MSIERAGGGQTDGRATHGVDSFNASWLADGWSRAVRGVIVYRA